MGLWVRGWGSGEGCTHQEPRPSQEDRRCQAVAAALQRPDRRYCGTLRLHHCWPPSGTEAPFPQHMPAHNCSSFGHCSLAPETSSTGFRASLSELTDAAASATARSRCAGNALAAAFAAAATAASRALSPAWHSQEQVRGVVRVGCVKPLHDACSSSIQAGSVSPDQPVASEPEVPLLDGNGHRAQPEACGAATGG